ncbi:MAG: hypothetical protein IMW97_00250 [Firmicutes bacterium]|nr:hypothetical protein [Candidatus Fermentithermobacillaceae bacterium]
MHIAGVVAALIIGVYTLGFARDLWAKGNKRGAIWAIFLALASTAVTLYYYYQHGFYP